MNKKLIVTIASVLLVAGAAAGTFFIIRNINEQPAVVVDQTAPVQPVEQNPETPEEPVPPVENFTSSFVGVDALHWAEGTVNITAQGETATLSFGDDFSSTPGPDLLVYLSPTTEGDEIGEVASLGPLKAGQGAQDYVLPANYKDYKRVVVWCRAFSVSYGSAGFSFN